MEMREQDFVESREEMERVLREQDTGYLAMSMNGHPYLVPLSYSYADGKILFHCSFTGKKLDLIRANPEVCFAVSRQPGEVRAHPGGEPCHIDNDSVICYGTARILDDMEEKEKALNAFNRRFRPGAEDLSLERLMKCCAVEISVSEMTGREEREKKRTYRRHRF
jgi:uncharacterized protein